MVVRRNLHFYSQIITDEGCENYLQLFALVLNVIKGSLFIFVKISLPGIQKGRNIAFLKIVLKSRHVVVHFTLSVTTTVMYKKNLTKVEV